MPWAEIRKRIEALAVEQEELFGTMPVTRTFGRITGLLAVFSWGSAVLAREEAARQLLALAHHFIQWAEILREEVDEEEALH